MKHLLLLLSIIFLTKGQNEFRLSSIYDNDMVLQMSPKRSQIWGWGTPGYNVSLILNSDTFLSTVTGDGKWVVQLTPQLAGGPYELIFNHGTNDTITLTGIYFGDVWLCSGQSNMDMKLKDIFNSTDEVIKAQNYTNIRIIQISEAISDIEMDEINGTTIPWSKTDISNLTEYSAACLLFGERMSDQFEGQRPIGLIEASWPGTRIEAWSSTEVTTICNTPPSEINVDQNADHVLWNAMIKPLTYLSVRGAIWYQGENNINYNNVYYSCHIQELIKDWRNKFYQGTIPVPIENFMSFPFGIFQLGPTIAGIGNEYGTLRWAQTGNQGLVPNQFMNESFIASSYDLTDRGYQNSMHPRDKQTHCTRLANAAKALLYDELYHMHAPHVVSYILNATDGNIILTYDRAISIDLTGDLAGFTYKLENSTDWMNATIKNISGRNLTVTYDPLAKQLAYAWLNTVCEYKQCTIYSADGENLPAQVWLLDL